MMSRCLDEGKKPYQEHEDERRECSRAIITESKTHPIRRFFFAVGVISFSGTDIQSQRAVSRKASWIAELGLARRSARAAKCGAMILAAVLIWLFLEAGE
jgi:hypothetical protein